MKATLIIVIFMLAGPFCANASPNSKANKVIDKKVEQCIDNAVWELINDYDVRNRYRNEFRQLTERLMTKFAPDEGDPTGVSAEHLAAVIIAVCKAKY